MLQSRGRLFSMEKIVLNGCLQGPKGPQGVLTMVRPEVNALMVLLLFFFPEANEFFFFILMNHYSKICFWVEKSKQKAAISSM